MSRSGIVAVAVLLIAATWGIAQEEPDGQDPVGLWERFLTWRTQRIEATDAYRVPFQGAGYAALQDTRMTPMVYRAPVYAAVMQNRAIRPKETVLTTFTFQFAYPLTDQTISGEASYLNPRGTIDVAYLRRFWAPPILVGGSLSWTGNLRTLDVLGNSALNYDLIASFNLTSRRQEQLLVFGRLGSWHAQVTLPVVSWVLRQPAYNISYAGSRTFWAAPWRFPRVRLNVGATRLLQHSAENRLSVDYFYDLYGMQDEASGDRLVMATHALAVGYALKTK